MPGAVALSILIHAALFLLAGTLVVFTVVKKEEKRFEPPKAVERPKMNPDGHGCETNGLM